MSQVCSVPKLTYFNLVGRVFGLRIALFKAFGKDGWIDDRIEFSQWADMKPKTPLGYLPILTLEDGEVRTQTDALTRWAGKKSGLYPSNEEDALIVDEVITTSFEALNKTPMSKNEEEKKKLRTEYAEGFLSKALTLLQDRVKAGNPWVAGSSLSVGDLTLVMLTDMIVTGNFDYVPPSLIVDGFPILAAHRDSVYNHELVKEYLKHYPN